MFENFEGYKLSKQADSDLEAIFDYTETFFGFTQAVKYLLDLETVINSLVINPEIGRVRDEIKLGLYSISEQEHTVFNRIQEKHIRIVRVLHGSKDLPKHF